MLQRHERRADLMHASQRFRLRWGRRRLVTTSALRNGCGYEQPPPAVFTGLPRRLFQNCRRRREEPLIERRTIAWHIGHKSAWEEQAVIIDGRRRIFRRAAVASKLNSQAWVVNKVAISWVFRCPNLFMTNQGMKTTVIATLCALGLSLSAPAAIYTFNYTDAGAIPQGGAPHCPLSMWSVVWRTPQLRASSSRSCSMTVSRCWVTAAVSRAT